MSEWIDVSFEAEGVRLYAVEAGRGAPVILLHGGLANHLACRAHAAPLVGSHRVITPDLRGSGRSHYAGELGWDQLADDIAAIVRQLGASRVAIGGVSFGSGVATAFALRHPSMVDRLMLVWPVYAGSDVGLMPAQREALEAMYALGRRAPAEGIEVILPLFDRLPPEIRQHMYKIASGYDPASVATSTKFMASGIQPIASASDLAAISAPTLVVTGVDAFHPASVAQLYADAIPAATLVEGDPAKAISAFLAE